MCASPQQGWVSFTLTINAYAHLRKNLSNAILSIHSIYILDVEPAKVVLEGRPGIRFNPLDEDGSCDASSLSVVEPEATIPRFLR
jgi:hypothetical protein